MVVKAPLPGGNMVAKVLSSKPIPQPRSFSKMLVCTGTFANVGDQVKDPPAFKKPTHAAAPLPEVDPPPAKANTRGALAAQARVTQEEKLAVWRTAPRSPPSESRRVATTV